MESSDEITIYQSPHRCGFPIAGTRNLFCSRIVGHEGSCLPPQHESLELVQRRSLDFARPPRLLDHLDVDAACLDKWTRGRKEHGAEWVGEPPLVEAYEEVIDLLNYLAEHLRTNPADSMVVSIRAMARALAGDLRKAALR